MRKVALYEKSKIISRSETKFRKKLKRKLKKQSVKRGWLKYIADMRSNCKENNLEFTKPSFDVFLQNRSLGEKPAHSEAIEFISSIKDSFSKEELPKEEDGIFIVPEIFSLTEKYDISFKFLKRLFYCLYRQNVETIKIDYANCQRIDVDASACMDIILRDYISYYEKCKRKGHNVKVKSIIPINYQSENILKILFSIGAFSTIRGFKVDFPDIIPYPLCIADSSIQKASEFREVHITEMVDYVLKCMAKMNRTLTPDAEKNLFQVIGEILINAEEHSSCKMRYTIGYFQELNENGQHIGIFHLVILNFGQTIYEKFKDPNCPNKEVVQQMKNLSDLYTKRKLFSKAEFEEQTLWTLYALQQGATSKADWRRGNGSIAFIESFFNLKGSQEKDNISYLSIVSGNTRINFDGTYRIKGVIKGKQKEKFKMMTFNNEGEIENKPDRKFVTFADNYFPGTIISAKICIKDKNTEMSQNE